MRILQLALCSGGGGSHFSQALAHILNALFCHLHCGGGSGSCIYLQFICPMHFV